jgi:ABC-type bacteriocin/lantibiotic exporter with double-glycine peptidase domain
MSESLKDILSNLNPEIDQETLMLYLQGKLSAEQQHEVEKQMMDNDFESDAIEGLQDFKNKQNINHLVDQLNKDLRKKTEKKKRTKQKQIVHIDPWVIISLVLILLLVVLAFVIIRQKVG